MLSQINQSWWFSGFILTIHETLIMQNDLFFNNELVYSFCTHVKDINWSDVYSPFSSSVQGTYFEWINKNFTFLFIIEIDEY